jgi:hypothetical protein
MSRPDQFDDASVKLAESRIARIALSDFADKVVAFQFQAGTYRLTIRLGASVQTLADEQLLTLFARANRLLAEFTVAEAA